jgi:hypothetical protein
MGTGRRSQSPDQAGILFRSGKDGRKARQQRRFQLLRGSGEAAVPGPDQPVIHVGASFMKHGFDVVQVEDRFFAAAL